MTGDWTARDLWYNEKKKRQRGFCMRIAEARKLKEGDVVITPHGFPLMVWRKRQWVIRIRKSWIRSMRS